MDFWQNRLCGVFENRLSALRVGTKWVPFLGTLNDTQVCGDCRLDKQNRLSMSLRDFCRETNSSRGD